MIDGLGKWYSGKICFFNDVEVDYRAEIEFDEYNRGIITVYGVTRDVYLCLSQRKYNSLIILLENKEYITAFDLYLKTGSCERKIDDDNLVAGEWKITIESSTILKGKKYFSERDTFHELLIEITDGYELIGFCPYDLNKNHDNILMNNDIEIPVEISSIHVNTIVGEFRFTVIPKYTHSKNSFSLGFSHQIQFKPINALKVTEIREMLNPITSFFCILSGETITINKVSLIKETFSDDGFVELIGICNFTKEKLYALDSSGMDKTKFKRVSLFKISDFTDLQKTLNYWFNHYNTLLNTQKAYSRILLDEELNVVTINKFLAAMQIIEGYTQAFTDGSVPLREALINAIVHNDFSKEIPPVFEIFSDRMELTSYGA